MRTKEALQTSPKSVRTGCARDLRGRTRSQAGRPPSSPLHLELAALARARAGAQSRTCWPQCVPRSEPSAGQGRVVVRLRGGETLEPLGPLSAASLSRRRPGVTRDAACHGACHGALGGAAPASPPPGPRRGGSGPFEGFPGPAAADRGVALGQGADLRRRRGRRDKGVGLRGPAPWRQVRRRTRRAEKEAERGPRGTRAEMLVRGDRGFPPRRELSAWLHVSALLFIRLGEGSPGESVGALGGLPWCAVGSRDSPTRRRGLGQRVGSWSPGLLDFFLCPPKSLEFQIK